MKTRLILITWAVIALTTPIVILAQPVIRIDGSSTVYPITEAVAEEFGREQGKLAKVTVGISGTGGGFKKFCAGETEIQNASRPIKGVEDEECKAKRVAYIELPIAYDALTVVVNTKNSWASSIKVSELKRMWEPAAQGKITRWSFVRQDWPDKPISLYGPGVDSGTFDYFTEAIVGKEDASRGDYTSSEDDNMLVQGVSGDIGALGFFGLAYYVENSKKVKALSIDAEKGMGPVAPSPEAVVDGTYMPLSRPLFVYVRKDAIARQEIRKFMDFYLDNAGLLAKEVGYVPLTDSAYKLVAERLEAGTEGSASAAHGSLVGLSVEKLLQAK